MALVEVEGLTKVYDSGRGSHKVEALKGVDFAVGQGEFVAIMGESGSGKTTLLNLLSLMDRPTDGTITLSGRSFAEISPKEQALFRREHMGYVFQEYNLLDTLTVRENILLPLVLAERKPREMEKQVQDLVGELGLESLLDRYPHELSGGQQQRVAVARAMVTSPKIILADEPTGALDSRASDALMQLFGQIYEMGQTVIMVTHSVKAAAYASRVLLIQDGRIGRELCREEMSYTAFYQVISEALSETLAVRAHEFIV